MAKSELNKTVGARIRMIRENMGYTRETFSALCDISDSFLSDVERGNKSLTTKTLHKICTSAHVSADFILQGTPSEFDEETTAAVDTLSFYVKNLSVSQQKHLVAIAKEFYLAVSEDITH